MSTAESMQPCGIRQCRTKHRKGYIIELAAGTVSHVGALCGKKHFGTSNWKVRLKAYREASESEARARAHQEMRARAERLLATPMAAPPDLTRVREMHKAFDLLPAKVRDSIIAKAQDRDGRITRQRPATQEEVKNAKFHGRRIPLEMQETIGNLIGLPGILPSSRADYLWDVAMPAALEALRSALDANADDLFLAIREIGALEARIQDAILKALDFFAEENLVQLRLLPTSRLLGIGAVVVHAHPEFRIELLGP